MAGSRARRSPGGCCTRSYSRYMQRIAEVAPQLVRAAGRDRRALHAPQLDRARPARSRCRWPTMPATASSPRSRTTISATSSARARSPRRRSTCSPSSCWPTASWSIQRAMPGSTNEAEKLPDYFISADDVTPEAARGYPGGGAEVGRLVDLQDGERADRFPVREVQGHLPVCPRAGPEGLHHVPLQPGGLPGRAGEGSGPEEHDLRVHARGRHGSRGARRRGDRVRRRDAHRRQSVRCLEGRLLREASEANACEQSS